MNRNMEIAVLGVVLALSACSGGGSSGMSGDYSPNSASGSMTTGSGPVTGSGSVTDPLPISISGTIAGLSGSGLALQLNGGAPLPVSADGTFTFPSALPSGTAYTVTVQAQPVVAREICGVVNGSGTAGTASITNVAVNCSTAIGFLYQLDVVGYQIYSYGISAGTGVPIALDSSVATGVAPQTIAVAPGGKYLYVVNANNVPDLPTQLGSVSTYAVDSDNGALTPVGSPVPAGNDAWRMAIASSGFLFVYNVNGAKNDPIMAPAGSPTLIEYALDAASGVPSLVGTVLTFPPTTAETSFVVTPDGRFLYVLTGSPEVVPPIPLTLTAYAIDPATGSLSPGATLTPNSNSFAMAVDPLGRFLYLTNDLGTPLLASGMVLPYAIDSTSGALTAIGTGTPVVSNMQDLAADPTGRYLYLTNSLNTDPANDTVQALSVDANTGSVGLIGSVIETGPSIFDSLVCDPSGQFAYLVNWADSTFVISTFMISTSPDTAGQLIPSGPDQPAAPYAGNAGAFVVVE